ncbi:hypothetical protein [Actinomycetospora termitidis]|uniref:Roadblock/LAMTOR2 domain-containing protein n=1 Tax=Actinomycetospora termitidis TaxID=3053470 RepID=A0ABT7MFD0_9PSEU|nr:hypothetical protein [Actinomycetospora sp. Odt1-22]MDL5159369.1 hypothetical protein [Actinomycetospora sp. Odt1-22]
MRADGLSTVLSSLLADRRVVAATLVDVMSGFVLDACTRDEELADLELLGAAHADLARAGDVLAPTGDAIVVDTGDGRTHVVRKVPDPHGDRIALTAVVRGPARVVARVRQRLGEVSVEALTAGPTLQRRPVDGRWDLTPAAPAVPAVAPDGLPGLDPVPTTGQAAAWAPTPQPAPWATAMTPPTPAPEEEDPDTVDSDLTDRSDPSSSGPAGVLTGP